MSPSFWARLAPIGPITSTVAALLRNGVTAMAAISRSPIASIGGTVCIACDSAPAMRSVPPVVRTASLTGMSAPSSTITGHSIVS